jgi:hypothetical protein
MPELSDLRPLLSSNVAQDVANYAGELQYQGNVEQASAGLIAFGGPTADFILHGVINGAFAQGPPNSDAHIESAVNPLPYWYGPVSVSGGVITCQWVEDADSPSGYNLRFTINPGSASDEAYLEQIIPIGGSRARWTGHTPRSVWQGVSSTSGFPGGKISISYLTAAGAVTGDDPFAEVTTAVIPGSTSTASSGGSSGISPPADAYFVRVRIGVYRNTMTSAARAVLDCTDVRLDPARPFVLVAEQSDPDTYAPGRITQDGGYLSIEPDGGSQSAKISVTLRGGISFPTIITPTISGDQDNYSPASIELCAGIYLTVSGATRTITGFNAADFDEGRLFWITPISNDLVLAHASGSSSAGNRIACPGAVNFTVPRSGGVMIVYTNNGGDNPFRVLAV